MGSISDENGNTETINCTPEHPFYVEGQGWIGAGSLHKGMTVRFSSGAEGTIKDILCEELPEPVTVYNFEVEGLHTYYVGGCSVLVHNSCTVTGSHYANINEGLNFTQTAANHTAEKGRHVPVPILKDVILHGTAMPDPQGTSAMMYYSRIYKNGKLYNIEVLYDAAINTVKHFMYAVKAMGNLPKI